MTTPHNSRKNIAAAMAAMIPDIANTLYRLTQGMSCPAELTVPQFKTLQFIHVAGRGLKMSELSKRLGIASSTLTETVKKLTAEGYLTRERSLEDDRVVILSLTAKSRKIMEEHIEHLERFFLMVCDRSGPTASKKLLAAHRYIHDTYRTLLKE